MPVVFKWTSFRVPQVLKDIHSDANSAVNEAAGDAVTVAQVKAPRDTGFMANTIEVVDEATDSNEHTATWGNVTANYTLWQEIGSRGRPGRYFLRQGQEQAMHSLEDKLKRKL